MSDLIKNVDELAFELDQVTPEAINAKVVQLVEDTIYGAFELAYMLSVRIAANVWSNDGKVVLDAEGKPDAKQPKKADFLNGVDFGALDRTYTLANANTIAYWHQGKGVAKSAMLSGKDGASMAAFMEWKSAVPVSRKCDKLLSENKGAVATVNGKEKKVKTIQSNLIKNGPRSLNNVIGTKRDATVRTRGTNAIQIVTYALDGKTPPTKAPDGDVGNNQSGLVIPDRLGGRLENSDKVTDADLISLVVSLRKDETSIRGLASQLDAKIADMYGKTLADERAAEDLAKTKANLETATATE
jgi:hypothetical protein